VEAAESRPDGALGRRLRETGGVDGHDAVALARAGDPEAARAVRVLGERLGVGIANMINLFDPLEVVIGGGVSLAGELLLEPARRVAAQHTLPGVGEQTTVRLARHGPQAGVLGAALIAAQEHALRLAQEPTA
jgi:glucokinase